MGGSRGTEQASRNSKIVPLSSVRRLSGLVVALSLIAMAATSVAQAAGGFSSPVFYAAGADPTAVAVGDLDRDGDSDLAIVNFPGHLRLLFNNGAGAFGNVAQYNNLWGADAAITDLAIGDLDGDGDNDLAVASVTMSGQIAVLLNHGNGTFGAPVSYDTCYSTQSVTIGDLDSDGDNDLAGANMCFKATVLVNNGQASFAHNGSYGNGYVPTAITSGDFNGDGFRDLAYVNHGI